MRTSELLTVPSHDAEQFLGIIPSGQWTLLAGSGKDYGEPAPRLGLSLRLRGWSIRPESEVRTSLSPAFFKPSTRTRANAASAEFGT